MPNGASTNSWHLMIDNYYKGSLIYYEDWPPGLPMDLSKRGNVERKWRFASPIGMFEDLADFFGDYLIAWYQ